ncbi:uncharacterized protein Dvir_GJ25916, isoform A [Drosophila virilis]|uniref:Uncharacterized protein, isoform A n=1 Tax=Drosophila virilis TaxID=7244 RepID=A0A0Q9WJK6_DROVI|nr:uncharacterized protein LOC26530686 isoform X4 [Drosophila virilis]KRF84778.1 uncharacterized protein Dvir_GJ25916, isoform A [Drosophila virilis]
MSCHCHIRSSACAFFCSPSDHFIGHKIIEITCIYVVYRYYLIMDPCRLVDEPERGRKKKSRKPLDKKACKESKKKEKKKKKSEKKNKR